MLGSSRARFLVALSLGAALAGGCGGDTETVPDDGKVRPAANGVEVPELEACNALKTAYSNKRDALACGATTLRGCPELLRVVYGTECRTYDEGTVEGCAAHYAKQDDCGALEKAFEDCVLQAIDKGADCD